MVGWKVHKDIASELGLKYKGIAYPRLKGIYRGREIVVEEGVPLIRPVGCGCLERTIRVEHRANIPSTIQLKWRSGLFFGKKKGITFNDPIFDELFLVEGEEVLVRQIFTPDIRSFCTSLPFVDTFINIEIDNRWVICKCEWLAQTLLSWQGKKWMDRQKEILRGEINLAVDLAEKIERL